jgi:hypothetical protein
MNRPSRIILPLSLLLTLLVLSTAQIAAQQKPRVFFSDDFFLESNPTTYLWFYDQKGILGKAHAVDGTFVEIVKAFAKNCECTVVTEPDDADYVVIVSRHDVVFRPKLAEKKFVVMKVDGEKLITKGSVRRATSIASDSCTAILKDLKFPSKYLLRTAFQNCGGPLSGTSTRAWRWRRLCLRSNTGALRL